MPNPFPGMNPWLENPALWSDVHFRLIAALARYLSPLVSPRYFVAVESQAYIAAGSATSSASPSVARYPDVSIVQTREAQPEYGQSSAETLCAAMPYQVEVPVPDVIEETYLEIRETGAEQIVAVIEVLSPTNKRPGAGRQKYERKRLEILGTSTHLIEIDLLCAWAPMPVIGAALASHYRVLVRRGTQGNQATLYPFNVRDAIPTFNLPLQAGDVEPMIDLKLLLDQVYAEARYDLRIHYDHAPIPPLSEADRQWAEEILNVALTKTASSGQIIQEENHAQ
jgi:hypothetical protein